MVPSRHPSAPGRLTTGTRRSTGVTSSWSRTRRRGVRDRLRRRRLRPRDAGPGRYRRLQDGPRSARRTGVPQAIERPRPRRPRGLSGARDRCSHPVGPPSLDGIRGAITVTDRRPARPLGRAGRFRVVVAVPMVSPCRNRRPRAAPASSHVGPRDTGRRCCASDLGRRPSRPIREPEYK